MRSLTNRAGGKSTRFHTLEPFLSLASLPLRLHADQLALGIPARHLRHAIVRMFDHLWVRESGVQSNGNNRNKADTTTNQAQTHGEDEEENKKEMMAE